MAGGATYFVVTLRGDIGPLTRQDLVEKLRAGEIAGSDQARTAFGRPLGTVSEVLGGEARRPPADPARTSARRAAPPSRPTVRTAAAGGSPALRLALVVGAVLVLGLLVVATVGRGGPAPAAPAATGSDLSTAEPAAQTGAAPTPAPPPPPPAARPQGAPGLQVEAWQLDHLPGSFSEAPDSPPTWRGIAEEISSPVLEKAGLRENFQARFQGFLEVPATGTYTFHLGSDDGSRLLIDGKLVLDNGGSHGFEVKSANCELTAGRHALRVDFFQGGGPFALQLRWQGGGSMVRPIPLSALWH